MAYKNRICGIYKIQNILNGKVYIGSSVHIMSRWSRHRTDLIKNKCCSIRLQNSYNKYGLENFKYSIIEECSIDELIIREQFYIDIFDSYENGYNSAPKAGNTLGYSPTQETRDKISKAMKGEKNPFYGKKHSEESLKKMSESHSGVKLSEEQKKKIGDTQRGIPKKPFTQEHKLNISKSRIEYYKKLKNN